MDGLSVSPWQWFLEAGPVGKGVMGLLVALSVWCGCSSSRASSRWRGSSGRSGARERRAANSTGADIGGGAGGGRGASRGRKPRRGADPGRTGDEPHRQGAAASARGRAAQPGDISSIAPFIGLFGTVWGIMTSFAGIALAKDTSLAVVAPGIAEALATTAFGLAAAIPASVGYTRIGAALGSAAAELGDWIEERGPELLAARKSGAR